MNLQELENIAAKCELCNLCTGRNKAVFAKGNPNSDIIICGMCPGPDENRVGKPFVGKAGIILDEIIYKAFNTKNYSSVYITNLVKCFVPPGQKLDQRWIVSCLPYFLVQISLIKPKVIITLGKDVSNFLLHNDSPIGHMRRRVYKYMKTNLISTYHPSYLARGGGIKHKDFNKVVNDFRLCKNLL